MKKRTTITDVLEAVNKGFTHVQTQIQGLDGKIDGVKKELKADIAKLTDHVDGFAKRQLKFDAELAAERAARERLEERIG